MNQLFKDTFGKDPVYPGHPLVLAWVILHTFPSLEDALTKDPRTGRYKALGSSDIPGSGGCVYSALGLLVELRKDKSLQDVYQEAASMWERIDNHYTRAPERYRSGQDQADKVLPLIQTFLQENPKWLKT